MQDAAVASAREAVRVLNNQYLAGTVAYTSVIVAEQTALSRCGNRVDDPSEPAGCQRQPDPGAWAAGGMFCNCQTAIEIEQAAPLNFNPLPPIVPVQGTGRY